MPIERGATVRQIVPVIEGVVQQRDFNDSHGCLQYLVEYGPGQTRWFLEGEIEVKPDPATPAAEAAPAEGSA